MRIALLLLFAATASAAADVVPTERARLHFDRGSKAYSDGDYALAISELELGRQLDSNPDFLYALAQAHRRSGDCSSAVALYVAFIATQPPDEEAAHARANIDRCATPTTPPPGDTEPALTMLPVPSLLRTHPSPPPEPWYADPPTDILASGGIVALGVGVTYLGFGERDARAANGTSSLASLQQHAVSANRERTIATIGFVGAAAFAVGAVVREVVVRRGHRSPAISLDVRRDLLVADWQVRF
jgi:hypothetical protein